ncbi:MAG: response regulator [Methanomassiliicoccales archaeon]|jgi:CheY-like chemotaxis protein|nr:response regulator [Methanomassiliicoccales archaeon]
MKILIVDDDDNLREMLRNMLSDFEVIEARNGREAVELARKSKLDVIIMDIMMPEMDGIEASRRILRENPKAVIICLTAFSGVKGPAMLEIGVREVISKPFRKNDLLSAIRRYALNS